MSALISMSELYSKLKEKSLSIINTMNDNNNSDSVGHNEVFEHNLRFIIDLCNKRLNINDHNTNDRNVNQNRYSTKNTKVTDNEKYVKKMSTIDGYRYKCVFNNDCNKQYIYKRDCKDHINAHTGEKPYKCDRSDCHFKSANKKCLESHIKWIHSTKKCHINYVNFRNTYLACDWNGCGYKCKFKYEFNRHKLTHSELNTYKCKVKNCGFKTIYKKSIDHHIERFQSKIVTQSEKNILTCDWDACEFKTAHKTLLSIHKRTHTKPFACNNCDYKSAYKGCLKQHIKRRHSVQI